MPAPAKPQPDLSTWLTTAETCHRLGISPRTLDRLCRDGHAPIRADRRRAGKKAQPVYDPADVARLATAADPIVMPRASTEERRLRLHAPNALGAITRGQLLPASLGAIQDLLRLAASAQPQPLDAAKPQWVTIPEACALTGLTDALIRRLVAREVLPAIRDRGWKIRRFDLATLGAASISSALSGEMEKAKGVAE